MTGTTRRLFSAALLCGALFSSTPVFAQGDLAEVQAQVAEARRRFDSLDYEQAVPALDRVIAILGARRTEDTQRLLADAYEMRARSRFGLGDQNGAKDDFTSLLKVDPARTLTGQISPRVVAIFDAARKATVTEAKLTIVPANATVMLDGAPFTANATIPILVGNHTLSATRLGYKAGTATFTANANQTTEASLTLARESAVVAIVTTPADVDVLVDGVARGKTAAGPPTPDYAERAARVGVPMAQLSAVLTLSDLSAGSHRLQFRRGCFVTAEQQMNIAQLEDIVLDPVKLTPAVATVVARSTQPGATVAIDGEDKGAAPVTTEICEGDHVVELRSANGRYARHVDARAGQRVEITGELKPAFALVSAGAQGALGADLRVVVEHALEPVNSVLVFAPAAEQVEQTLKASQLPPDWLSFDANKRPLGTSADISAPMRRDLSLRLAKAFNAQGVASVSVPSPLTRNRVVVTLLSAGSAEPDVIELNLDQPESISNAVALLNRPLSFLRPSMGLTPIDVADMSGAAVIAVEPNGPAAKAGVQAGDVIVKAGDQVVADSAALAAALAGKHANDTLTLELKDRAGAAKKAEVKVFMTPRLIGMNDQTLLANRIVVDLRTRLLSPSNPAEESIIRLNMAAALARLQAWSEARTELQKVKLPEGPGVGNGTVQYLLGLCADNLGNRSEAELAWRTAASSESFLTEDGPPVKELAEAKIAELQRRPAGRN
jgi:tetratricopeptide (TPR) repeat protein